MAISRNTVHQRIQVRRLLWTLGEDGATSGGIISVFNCMWLSKPKLTGLDWTVHTAILLFNPTFLGYRKPIYEITFSLGFQLLLPRN